MAKKKNLVALIDGENISPRLYPIIKNIIHEIGTVDEQRVYGLRKDPHTRRWSSKSKKENTLKDIRLPSGAKKNKVDKEISKDAIYFTNTKKNMDILVMVSSDGGYADTVRKLREKKKRVVVIGEKKTPKKLRDACSEFIEI